MVVTRINKDLEKLRCLVNVIVLHWRQGCGAEDVSNVLFNNEIILLCQMRDVLQYIAFTRSKLYPGKSLARTYLQEVDSAVKFFKRFSGR